VVVIVQKSRSMSWTPKPRKVAVERPLRKRRATAV
jgi:hypothetical protein